MEQTVVLRQTNTHQPWCGLTYIFTFFPVPCGQRSCGLGSADPVGPLSSGGSARYLVIFVHGGGTGSGAGVTGTIKVQVSRCREGTVGAAVYVAETQPASSLQNTILDFLLQRASLIVHEKNWLKTFVKKNWSVQVIYTAN